ncbi:MAG: segregation/condensation protein A [Candidatus Altiarchaeota archaeon]
MDFDTLIESEDLTWRDILYEVIKESNPWDIDLSELATRYSKRVQEMREMNFRIPANVVLVSSVLLRMKADILNPVEKEPYNELAASFQYFFGEEIPDYSSFTGAGLDELEFGLKPKRVITRRVTAEELIGAIEKALLEYSVKKSRLFESANEPELNVLVLSEEFDLNTIIEETYTRVLDLLTKKEVVLFSELAKTKREIISTFLSLLHLSNREQVHLRQEKLFGEIYIRSNPFLD